MLGLKLADSLVDPVEDQVDGRPPSRCQNACRARTAAPVAMEMSRRFMGRLSLTRGAGQKRASQVLRRRDVILRLAAEG